MMAKISATVKLFGVTTDRLHHAYCLVGDRAILVKRVKSFIEEELNTPTAGNPDFFCVEFDTLAIDESRLLKERVSRKAFSSGKKYFVLAFNFITSEAQNSLLKLLEEPSEDTMLFLIVPSAEMFFATVRSRIQIISDGQLEAGLAKREGNDFRATTVFLGGNLPQRLKIAKELAEAVKEGESRAEVIRFLDELEREARAKLDFSKHTDFFKRLIQAKKYLSGRSPSVKLVLEQLALLAAPF